VCIRHGGRDDHRRGSEAERHADGYEEQSRQDADTVTGGCRRIRQPQVAGREDDECGDEGALGPMLRAMRGRSVRENANPVSEVGTMARPACLGAMARARWR
jgi:hypothetical protein